MTVTWGTTLLKQSDLTVAAM